MRWPISSGRSRPPRAPMAVRPLPHAYPFRFVDQIVEQRDETFSRGRVRLAVSAGQRAASGGEWGSPLMLAEAIAQSALLLEGGDAEIGRRGFLAGLEAFSALRAPRPGEMIDVDVRLSARFGSLVRFSGVVTSGGEEIARG